MHSTLEETKQDIKGINIQEAINTLQDEDAHDYLVETLLSGEEVTPATQAAYKNLVSSLADSIGQHFANEDKANEFQEQLKSFKFTLSDIQSLVSLAKINMPDQHIMGLTLIGLTLLDMPNILENLDINEDHKQEIEAHIKQKTGINDISLSSISHKIKQLHILKLFVYKEYSVDYSIPFKSLLQEMRSKESIQEAINVLDMFDNNENLSETERKTILSNLAIHIEKSLNLTDEDIDQLIQGQDMNEDFRNILRFIMPDNLPVISTFLSSSDIKGFLNDVEFTSLTDELNKHFSNPMLYEAKKVEDAIQRIERQIDPGNNQLISYPSLEEKKAELRALNEEIIRDSKTKTKDSIEKIGMSILSKSLKIKAYASLPALVTGIATTAILLYFTSVGALYSSLYGLAALALFLPISLFQGSMYQDLSTSYKTKGYAFDIVTALLTTVTVACPALIVYGNLLAIPSAIMITLGVIAPLAIGFLTINLMQRTAAITNFKFSAGVNTREFSPETMANPGKFDELKESWNQRLANMP